MMEYRLIGMRAVDLRREAERDRQAGEIRRAARAARRARAVARQDSRAARRLTLVTGRR
jgi:hypothetical protein